MARLRSKLRSLSISLSTSRGRVYTSLERSREYHISRTVSSLRSHSGAVAYWTVHSIRGASGTEVRRHYTGILSVSLHSSLSRFPPAVLGGHISTCGHVASAATYSATRYVHLPVTNIFEVSHPLLTSAVAGQCALNRTCVFYEPGVGFF